MGPAAEAVVEKLKPGQIAMLENLRYHAEEEKTTQALRRLSQNLATSTSTTPSRFPIARTRPRKRWPACCPLMPDRPCSLKSVR